MACTVYILRYYSYIYTSLRVYNIRIYTVCTIVAARGVRITPKGNIQGFPIYIPWLYTRSEPSGKRNELVFSAVSLLRDTIYTHTAAQILLHIHISRAPAILLYTYVASNIRFSRKRLYFFQFTILYYIKIYRYGVYICACKRVHAYIYFFISVYLENGIRHCWISIWKKRLACTNTRTASRL